MAPLVLLAAPPPARADVAIAVPYPHEGPYAALGRRIADAVELAAHELNTRGGVAGEKVAVHRIDDGCNAAGASRAAATIAGSHPALIVGHPCAGGAVAAARVYAPARLLYIATETRHPALTDRRAGPTIFRLSGRDDAQGTEAGQYLAGIFPGRRIAVVSDRTAYARSIVEKARLSLAAAGAEPAMLTIVAGEKDYGALVARIRDWQCAAVLFAGFPVEAASVLRQMRAAGIGVPLLGTDAVATDELTSAAGSAAEGILVVTPADPARWPAAAGLVKLIAAAGQLSDSAAVRAYIAVELWAAAAAAKGTTAPEIVAAALAASPRMTAIGPVGFDAKGDARLPSYDVLAWRQARWTLASP